MTPNITFDIQSSVNGDRVVAYNGAEYLIQPMQVETRLEALEEIQRALAKLIEYEHNIRGYGKPCEGHQCSPCCVCSVLYE